MEFSLQSWKHFYANHPEIDAVKYFWENINLSKFSIWFASYKKSSVPPHALVSRFFESLEPIYESVMASFLIFGDEHDNEIHGVLILKGHDLPFKSIFTFTRVDVITHEIKQNVNAFFMWEEVIGVSKFNMTSKPFYEGRTFAGGC